MNPRMDMSTRQHLHGAVAVVLAGGSSTRIGTVGRFLPKSLLPISDGDTLLSRLLSQLLHSDVERIVVSTTPARYNLMRAFVNGVVDVWQAAQGEETGRVVEVYENEKHLAGPLPALAEVLSLYAAPSYIFCLSDIFFVENPFHELKGCVKNSAALFVGPYLEARGGVVFGDCSLASRLSYKPVLTLGPEDLLGNWSGAAWLPYEASRKIQALAACSAESPLEHVFNELLSGGERVEIVRCSQFVNVNTLDDLWQCWKLI